MNENYDPTERRETPLLTQLRQTIHRDGPISVGRYMQMCLSHPEHGYYISQTAIGGEGDFITAPEISQVFGELVGLWAVVVWQQMGSPQRVRLVEIGPGRGTLMADALRAAANHPEFRAALTVDLVEISPVLRQAQEKTLSAASVRTGSVEIAWHSSFADIPDDAPIILIANEFLDTCSIDQFIVASNDTVDAHTLIHSQELTPECERRVGLDDNDGLIFLPTDEPRPEEEHESKSGKQIAPTETSGAILERPSEDCPLLAQLAARHARPSAALFIDYGHGDTGLGETLQAIRGHKHEHVLTSPGEADLSAHVDFARFGETCQSLGFAVDGPTTQAEFLGNLGAIQRASRLMSANPDQAMEIEAGLLRLMAPNGMGTRFKAIGVRHGDVPPLPGFPGSPNR